MMNSNVTQWQDDMLPWPAAMLHVQELKYAFCHNAIAVKHLANYFYIGCIKISHFRENECACFTVLCLLFWTS